MDKYRLPQGEEHGLLIEVAGRTYQIWIGAPMTGQPTIDLCVREEMPDYAKQGTTRFIANLRVELP